MIGPRLKTLAACTLATAFGVSPALAQAVTAAAGTAHFGVSRNETLSHPSGTMQTVHNPNQPPLFHLFGIPVVIAAPVDAPYNQAAAYSTFAGQPGYGPNAVLAAAQAGTP